MRALQKFGILIIKMQRRQLQNMHLGAQARPNYTYKARRRANNMIMTGHSITPSTDPGDYVVEANADLILEAEKVIKLVPGTHFKAGSKVHIMHEIISHY